MELNFGGKGKDPVASDCHKTEKGETVCVIRHGSNTGSVKFVENPETHLREEIARSIQSPEGPAMHQRIANEIDAILGKSNA
jgi:hypothetical protein